MCGGQWGEANKHLGQQTPHEINTTVCVFLMEKWVWLRVVRNSKSWCDCIKIYCRGRGLGEAHSGERMHGLPRRHLSLSPSTTQQHGWRMPGKVPPGVKGCSLFCSPSFSTLCISHIQRPQHWFFVVVLFYLAVKNFSQNLSNQIKNVVTFIGTIQLSTSF